MSKKGHKSSRNVPELYDEKKEQCSLSLTPTAVKYLNDWSKSLALSRSELVERIARGTILLKN